MSFRKSKLGAVFLLSSIIIAGACTQKSSSGLTPAQKKQLDSLSKQTEDGVTANTDSEEQSQNKSLADLSQENEQLKADNAQLKKDSDIQAVTQARLNLERAQENDYHATQSMSDADQRNLKASITDDDKINEDLKAKILEDQKTLAKEQALVDSTIAANKAIREEGQNAMNIAFKNGQQFPVAVIVYKTTPVTHKSILKEISKSDSFARNSFEEDKDQYGVGTGTGTSKFVYLASNTDIKTYVSKNLNLLGSIFPFYRFVVKTYVNLSYTTPTVYDQNSTPDDLFPIGQSAPVTVGLAYSQMALDDVYANTNLPQTCGTVTPQCISDLRSIGYIDGDDKKDSSGTTSSAFFIEQLNKSVSNVDPKSGKWILPWTETHINNVSLIHKVAVEVYKGDVTTPPEYVEMPFNPSPISTDSQFTKDDQALAGYLKELVKTLSGPIQPESSMAKKIVSAPVVVPGTAAAVAAPATVQAPAKTGAAPVAPAAVKKTIPTTPKTAAI